MTGTGPGGLDRWAFDQLLPEPGAAAPPRPHRGLRTDHLGRTIECQAPECHRPLPIGRRSYCSDQCRIDAGHYRGPCQAPGCGRAIPRGRRRFCSDICRLRGQRSERVYDPGQVGQNVVRLVKSMSGRAGQAGLAELGSMWAIMEAADAAAVRLIDDLRDQGESWETIGAELGITRQAAQQWRSRRGEAALRQRSVDSHEEE